MEEEVEEVDESGKMLEDDLPQEAGESGSSSASEDEEEFPDTAITVAHVAGET